VLVCACVCGVCLCVCVYVSVGHSGWYLFLEITRLDIYLRPRLNVCFRKERQPFNHVNREIYGFVHQTHVQYVYMYASMPVSVQLSMNVCMC